MITAFVNIFRIEELRRRVLFTLLMIVAIRLGAWITLPGVDAIMLNDAIEQERQDPQTGGLAAMINIFSGGALMQVGIFALGIMPYISASIMMQLMTAVFPQLARLKRQEGGQQKITQYTRMVTLGLCIVQGYLLAISLQNPASNPFLVAIADRFDGPLVPNFGTGFIIVAVMTITAGTMLLMWMGDQISERGVGNGISLIITVNIMAGLPAAAIQTWNTFIVGAGDDIGKPLTLVMLIAFFIGVTAAIIAITVAVRKITVQYAKRVQGRKVMGGQQSFLPLKVNYAGVMPIIFASALLTFPQALAGMIPNMQGILDWLSPEKWPYYLISALMIFFFSYFWVATQFQPSQIADDLKKAGGYIPGVRPGKPTSDFLDYTMTRLTFAGAIFLTIIAVLPPLLSVNLGVPFMASQFFGGTSLLIIVGVLLDLMRQVETQLLQRHYDGFLRKGKMRGRAQASRRGGSSGKTLDDRGLVLMSAAVAVLVIIFIVILIAGL